MLNSVCSLRRAVGRHAPSQQSLLQVLGMILCPEGGDILCMEAGALCACVYFSGCENSLGEHVADGRWGVFPMVTFSCYHL